MGKIRFRLAAYTDSAGKRTDVPPLYGNEDNFYVDSNLSGADEGVFVNDEETELSDWGSLLVVADGMGGMNAGEVASEIAIRTVRKFFAHSQMTKEIVATPKSRERYMEKVVVEADTAVKEHAKANPECEGMGSTIIMCWICDGVASVTWCGDSRVYLFRDSVGLKQISKDHSYVQSLVDEGKITEDQAFDHPYGNIITRSLGEPDKHAQADSITVPIYKGDIILVNSDGLSGVLRDHKTYDSDGDLIDGDNLEDIIRANQDSMQKCRLALWDAAEKADWYDNVTAILYQITKGASAPAPAVPAEGTGSDAGHTDPEHQFKSKSFISIKLHKKTIKWVIAVIVVIVILILLGLLYKKYWSSSDNDQTEYKIVLKDGTQINVVLSEGYDRPQVGDKAYALDSVYYITKDSTVVIKDSVIQEFRKLESNNDQSIEEQQPESNRTSGRGNNRNSRSSSATLPSADTSKTTNKPETSNELTKVHTENQDNELTAAPESNPELF